LKTALEIRKEGWLWLGRHYRKLLRGVSCDAKNHRTENIDTLRDIVRPKLLAQTQA
jgi:hypothetical protein